jgi:hypothetical protein
LPPKKEFYLFAQSLKFQQDRRTPRIEFCYVNLSNNATAPHFYGKLKRKSFSTDNSSSVLKNVQFATTFPTQHLFKREKNNFFQGNSFHNSHKTLSDSIQCKNTHKISQL